MSGSGISTWTSGISMEDAFANNPFAEAGRVASEQAYGPARQMSINASALSDFNLPTTTTGMGTAGMVDGQLQAQLDPRFAGQSQALLNQATGAFGQLSSFDPNVAAQEQFSRLESLMAPERQAQQMGLESRLFSQGRLGSTGGAGEQQALQSAIQQQQSANAIGAFEQAMQRQQQLQGMGLQALQGAGQLEQMPLQNLQAGLGVGQADAAAGARQGAFIMEPLMAQARMHGEGALGLTTDFTDFMGGMMGGMSGGGMG